MSITVAMRTQVSQLYVSLFGRAPDAEGLGFWASALADGMTMSRLAQEMYNTAPARDYYPTAATNREIIATFYLNVLGREADAGGLDFWTAEMNRAATKGEVFAKLLNNVVNYTGSDAAGLKSQALFLNKVAVAQYYGESDGDIIHAADVLVGVTDKYATVIEAKAAIDAGVVIGVQTYEVLNEVSITEGGAVTFNITTTGVAPGTEIAYSVTGTGNALASTQLGVVTVNASGKASVTVSTLENSTMADQGVLTFSLISGSTVLAAAELVNVLNNDAAKTYTVLNVASINEGNSVTYNITTTGVAAGTEVAYMVTGTGNASSSAQVGAVVINAEGKASVTISTIDNNAIGDDGIMSFRLISGSEVLANAALVNVTNNDGAKTYAVANVASISEGHSITYNITTTGVAAGTEVSYVVTGTGNASSAAQVGSVVINAEGKASVTINTTDNLVVGDDGTLNFVLKNGSEVLATATAATVTNNDNPATYEVTVNDTSINEGDVLTYSISTTGVAPGTDIAYVVTGTGNATASTQVGLATINAQGKATVNINTYENSIVADAGVLSFKLVSNSNTLVQATNVNIANDDLPPPDATAVVTAKEIFGTGGIYEGDIIEFTVSTTGYAAGAVLPYAITGTNNVAGIIKAGFVTIDVHGKGVVQVQTTDNAQWDDAGSLCFNLGDLTDIDVTVLNDDVEIIDNTYVLTEEADDSEEFSDTNGGDDIFMATIGSYDPTLTISDKLDGGSGNDTLYIKVNGEGPYGSGAEFPELVNDDTPAFTSIENVIIDLSDHDIAESGYAIISAIDMYYSGTSYSGQSGSSAYVGAYYDAIDVEFFDTDGSLETITLVAEKDVDTQTFEDLYIHKDMTVRYVGSNVPFNAVELDENILLDTDVSALVIELDGVTGHMSGYGAYYGNAGSAGHTLALTQVINDNEDDNGDSFFELTGLETLTVNGELAQSIDSGESGFGPFSNGYDVQATLSISSVYGYNDDNFLDGGDQSYAAPSPETINIGLTKTEYVDSVFVTLGKSFGYYGNDLDASLLRNASTIDFTESTVNIRTWIWASDMEADTVDINFGEGDDILILDILPASSDPMDATAITIDLGDYEDENEIVLSNVFSTIDDWEFSAGMSAGEDHFGGNIKLDSYGRDVDLNEDLITIDNFEIGSDKLSLDLLMVHGSGDSTSSAYEEVTYIGNDFTVLFGTDVQDAADDGAALRTNDSGRQFYSAVEAVANYLADKASDLGGSSGFSGYDEANQYYAAAFVYKGDAYIYVDTNRNGWDEIDEGNVGLSNGDTLIKLTGIETISPALLDLDSGFLGNFVLGGPPV